MGCSSGIIASKRNAAPPPIPPLNPAIWMDGGDGTTFVLNGSDVVSWQSKGSVTSLFVPRDLQVTTPKCQRITNGVFFPNPLTTSGAPAACLYVASAILPISIQWTHFIVASDIGARAGSQSLVTRIVSQSDNANDNARSIIDTNGKLGYTYIRNSTATQQSLTVNTTGFDTTNKFLMTNVFSTPTLKIDMGSGALTNSAPTAFALANFSTLYLGSDRRGTGSFPAAWLTGNIHEVLLYSSALSAPDIALVQTYLNTKWNL